MPPPRCASSRSTVHPALGALTCTIAHSRACAAWVDRCIPGGGCTRRAEEQWEKHKAGSNSTDRGVAWPRDRARASTGCTAPVEGYGVGNTRRTLTLDDQVRVNGRSRIPIPRRV